MITNAEGSYGCGSASHRTGQWGFTWSAPAFRMVPVVRPFSTL